MALGRSQTELGASLGVTFQQVQKYEKGKNRIAAAQLVQLGRFLNVHVSYFFDGLMPNEANGTADTRRQADLFSFVATPEGARLCAAFGRIARARTRKSLIQLVCALVEELPTEPDTLRYGFRDESAFENRARGSVGKKSALG